jgi:hypothetical protein
MLLAGQGDGPGEMWVPGELDGSDPWSYLTPGGRRAACRVSADDVKGRQQVTALVDAGLVEVVEGDGRLFRPQYDDPRPVAWIVRVADREKCLEALERMRVLVPAASAPPRAPRRPRDPALVARRKANPFASLPQIVYLEEVVDCGPGEGGNAPGSCPHCGADGRWIYRFRCADGSTRGAMAGCFAQWPRHRFVAVAAPLVRKVAACAGETRRTGREWKLPSWDQAILDAIRAFAAGTMAEAAVDAVIRNETARARAYRDRRFGGRR